MIFELSVFLTIIFGSISLSTLHSLEGISYLMASFSLIYFFTVVRFGLQFLFKVAFFDVEVIQITWIKVSTFIFPLFCLFYSRMLSWRAPLYKKKNTILRLILFELSEGNSIDEELKIEIQSNLLDFSSDVRAYLKFTFKTECTRL